MCDRLGIHFCGIFAIQARFDQVRKSIQVSDSFLRNESIGFESDFHPVFKDCFRYAV